MSVTAGGSLLRGTRRALRTWTSVPLTSSLAPATPLSPATTPRDPSPAAAVLQVGPPADMNDCYYSLLFMSRPTDSVPSSLSSLQGFIWRFIEVVRFCRSRFGLGASWCRKVYCGQTWLNLKPFGLFCVVFIRVGFLCCSYGFQISGANKITIVSA